MFEFLRVVSLDEGYDTNPIPLITNHLQYTNENQQKRH